MKLCPILALLLLSIPIPPKQDQVMNRLAHVSYFAFGAAGFAGHASAGEQDFRLVMARSSAAADLEKLYTQGNLEAKCYALVGLHRLDSKRFIRLAKPLRSSSEEVRIMRACIVSRESVDQLISEIESGKYRQ